MPSYATQSRLYNDHNYMPGLKALLRMEMNKKLVPILFSSVLRSTIFSFPSPSSHVGAIIL